MKLNLEQAGLKRHPFFKMARSRPKLIRSHKVCQPAPDAPRSSRR